MCHGQPLKRTDMGKLIMRPLSRQILGWIAVFLSAFCFYLTTVIIRMSADWVTIASPYFVFSRFLLGFLVVCCSMLLFRQWPAPKRYHFLFGRMLANSIAVFCFYKAVEVTTVAQANILNMTYPLFVTLFSWFLLPEQRDRGLIIIVLAACTGIWLILAPGGLTVQWQSLWGLISGISAAFAMLYLNVSRRYHDSQTILFFMFGFGALLLFLLFRQSIFLPDWFEFLFLFSCSAAGVVGQYLLTFGFRYVTAVEGSVISSTRILLAAMLGPLLVADPRLTPAGWLGALLIFATNIALTVKRTKPSSSRTGG